MIKLDIKDKKILSVLDKNARMPYSKISNLVRLNRDVVKYRIKKLEKKGIITDYYTIIDNSKLGYLSIRIYLKFFDVSLLKEQEIIDFLRKNPKIGVVFQIDGHYDLGIIVWVKNIYELEEILNKFKFEYSEFVDNINITIFTKIYHYPRKYILDTRSLEEPIIIGNKETTKIDATDLRILKLISDNAKISIVNLSKRLNITPKTLIYRIKQLERKKIIKGYRANININLIGYENYFIEIYLKNPKNVKEIEYYVRDHSNFIYSDKIIGGADIETEVEVKNKNELQKIIIELRSKFNNIRKYRYLTTTQYIKISYLPK